MAERFDPTKSALIQQAVAIQDENSRIGSDEAEATRRVPALKKRIDEFILSFFPEESPEMPTDDQSPLDLNTLDLGFLGGDQPSGLKVVCLVPLANGNEVEVTVTRGIRNLAGSALPKYLTVDMDVLPDILVISHRGEGSIQSREHNFSEWNGIIGPGGRTSDLGPVSSRCVRTSDITQYTELFVDVLEDPRVVKTPSRFDLRNRL